jgi:hypothetical protein
VGEKRCPYGILLERCEGKRVLWKHRHRWEDNIKMDAKETEWGDVDCIQIAQEGDKWQAV